ncbi:MAG TPA: lysophospholipid acyltransferase family protein [Vicinamibacterales bacterium]|nr:lysophospholipid acyltransferase family protein [Vicinamibacterales bacterium]
MTDAPSRRPTLQHRLEHIVVATVRSVVRILPMGAVLSAGTLLGALFHALDGPHRRLALSNLEAAFPARPPQERAAIARDMFGHFGRLLMVLLKFSTMRPADMLARVEFEGEDRVKAAHALGRGALLFTGHFGYWEINALVHALALQPMAVLARPLDNPLLNDLLEQVRCLTGNSVIYRRGALRRVLRTLAANQAVAMLIDQHVQTDAVYVDFFNRPVSTTTALAAIALRTGAPVIPVFALPLPDGRFRVVYEHAVDPPKPDDPDALRDFTQRCTDVLEMYVRRYPGLWLWMHRRWRDIEPATERGMFPAASSEGD